MMKTTYPLFSTAALILVGTVAGTLAACDGRTPKVAISSSPATANHTAEGRKEFKKAQEKTGPVLDDSTITALAEWAIAGTSDLKNLNISVQTVQGRVTLSGNVPSQAESRRAASVISNLKGVKSVENRLAVTIYV
jgi:osmotically-inducible protein OsmY